MQAGPRAARPEPPRRPVMMTTFSPFGVGPATGNAAGRTPSMSRSGAARADHAGLVEHVLRRSWSLPRQRAGMRNSRPWRRPMCGPAFSHHDRLFFLRHAPWRLPQRRGAVLQVPRNCCAR